MYCLAPAKVNLFLKVLRKRADGYHDILSLMQKITLCDELIFRVQSQGIALHCSDPQVPADGRNLIVRAAKALFEYCGCRKGVSITLIKKIPVAAGLGGGSSDAATALLALNRLFSFRLKKTDLVKLGSKIGADVPFFIFGNAAWAAGIGDKLRHVSKIPKFNFVLIKPPFEISTKEVYKKLNLRLTRGKNNYSIPRLLSRKAVIRGLFNDLESVSMKMHPELSDLKQVLIKYGALGALMSGSGPTVFGIFRNGKEAKEAFRKLGRKTLRDYRIFLAESV